MPHAEHAAERTVESGRYPGRVLNKLAGRSATDADRLGPTESGSRTAAGPTLAATGHG